MRSLSATASLGRSIYIDESDDIVIEYMEAEGGNINLSVGGDVVGASMQLVDVNASTLAISAGGAIMIDTQIDTGRFSTTLPGDIQILSLIHI